MFPLLKSKESKTALFIFLFALLFRTFYLFDYTNNPLIDFVDPAFDQSNFDAGAQNFVNGDWLARAPGNSSSPLYKYFLGLIYFFFGRSFPVVFFVQFIIGSLSSTLVFLVGRKMFGYGIAVCSAICYAAYGPNLFYEGILLREFLVPFLALLSIFTLICFKEIPSTRNALFCGISLSLFLQNRPNVLTVFPLLFFYFKDFYNPDILKKIKILFLTFFLFSLPLLAQCYMVHSRLVFYDASGPLALYAGNVTDQPGVGYEVTPKVNQFMSENKLTLPNVIKGILHEMANNPLDFLKLYLRKTFYLFHGYEEPSNLNFYVFRQFSPLLGTPWSNFSLYTSLGLVGILIGFKQINRLKILYIFFAGLSISILLVYVTGRFRPPLVPFMMLFSFYTIFYLAYRWKEKNYKKLFLPLVSATVLLIVFNQYPEWEKIRAIDYGHLGKAYSFHNNPEMALISYRKATKIRPDMPDGYLSMASVYQTLHLTQQAKEILHSGITKAHSSNRLEEKLAQLYFESGQYQIAEQFMRKGLIKNPDNAKLRYNLAIVLINLNKTKEAVIEFNRVLRIQPNFPGAEENLKSLLRIEKKH